MATNPMQRKARNSFLLGMLLMLVILGTIIAVLVFQLLNKIKEENKIKEGMVSVYILKDDVKSGQEITDDMLEKVDVYEQFVPANATATMEIVETWKMQDKEGNKIYIKPKEKKNDDGTYKLFIKRNKAEYEVKREKETKQYYIGNDDDKTFIELNTVPLVAKIDMKANTVLTEDLITNSDNIIYDDIRKQEYNVVVLPADLATGDFIDIRIMYPNGQDFIIVAKKQVEIPNISGVDSVDTIWSNFSEEEIIHMSCAIIEAAKVPGTKIYANKYTDPGIQKAATPTYIVNDEAYKALMSDPNKVYTAINKLNERYNNGNDTETRRNINDQVRASETEADVQTKIDESITNSKNVRKEYIESLAPDIVD